jgi:very-short-patch-repair endonuclease
MSLHTRELLLSAWLASHQGVVARTKLEEFGFKDGSIRTLLDAGRIVAFHPGVYLSTSVPRTELQRVAALGVAADGVISHTSAGRIWDFRKLVQYNDLHVTITHGRRVRTHEGIVHQSTHLPADDLVERDDGIVVTSPPRTVFDLAAICPADDLESISEQALDREMFIIPTLHAVGRRLAGPGRDGSANFATVLARRETWRRPVQSDLELKLATALEQAGVAPLERQWKITLPDGSDIHADLAVPERRFLIEVDHVTWHGGRLENMYDRWRDRQCHLLGWHTERVPDTDISDHLARTVAELAELFRAQPVSSTPALPQNVGRLKSQQPRRANRPRPA